MQDQLTEAELTLLKRVSAEGFLDLNVGADPEGAVAETLTTAGLLRGVRPAGASERRTFVLSGAGLRVAEPIRLRHGRKPVRAL